MKKIGIGIAAAIMDVDKVGLAVVVISVVLFIVSFCWSCYEYDRIQKMPEAEQVTVELTDKENNSYVVTGKGVTDESGKVMLDLTAREDEKEKAEKQLNLFRVWVSIMCITLFFEGIWLSNIAEAYRQRWKETVTMSDIGTADGAAGKETHEKE